MLTAAQYALLKTEIQTDPAAKGYAALVAIGDDVGVAAILNAIDSNAANDVVRESISARDLFEAIDATEWAALTQLPLLRLQILLTQMGQGSVDVRGSNMRALLATVFPAGGPTRTALAAAAKRHSTRAEQVLGVLGIAVTHTDVAIALRGN